MKKFKLNLWSQDEKKRHHANSESAVIDGVDGEQGQHPRQKIFFGIKNYLHQFYLASPTNPFADDVPAALAGGGGGAWLVF
jgi:hypothetical protein